MSFLDSPFVPNGKTDRAPIPSGEENKFFSAEEWNEHICQPLLDLRSHALAGFTGLTDRGSAPSGLSGLATTTLWGKTDGNLVRSRLGTDSLVALGVVSAKGDLLVFDGTNFVVLPAGSNTQVLTADSAQASGLKWATGAGAGTVTQVATGAGLTGGPITTTGTISMPNVGPGSGTIGGGLSFINSLTLDAQGRVTAAVASTITESDVTNLVADLAAKALAIRTITAGTGLTGGGDLSANRTLALADTAVTPSTYGDGTHVGQFTVDQQGRLTGAASVAITGFVPTSRLITAGTGLSGGGDLSADRIISMPNVGPGAATYGGGGLFISSLTLDAQGRVSALATAVAGVGWFDVKSYGAVGDGTTDDGPAFQAACDAAASIVGNGRSGIVYASPCLDSYRIATPVTVAVAATGADTFTIMGCGQDSPIKLDLTNSQDAFTLTGVGEWFSGRLKNLTILTSDITQATVDCRDAFRLGASGPGTWDVEDITSIGTYCYGNLFHLLEGYYRINNIHDGSTICFGADYTYMFNVDGSDLVEFDGIYSFWQHHYRGTDLSGGTARALIGVTPRVSSDYNGNKDGTKVLGRNLFSNPRNLQLVYCVGDATHIAKSICLEQFFVSSGGNDCVYVDSCENVELRLGTMDTSGSNTKYDLGPRIKHFVLDRVVIGSAGGQISVLADAGVGHIEVVDSPLNAVTNAPCGVQLGSDTATAAFITANGLRARVRVSDSALVVNTLTKMGTTGGRVAQLTTSDSAILVAGVALEAASGAGKCVRVVEMQGQQVSVKSDGSATISPGDVVEVSSTQNGYIRAGSTNPVGVNAGLLVAASLGDLCEVL